MTELSWIQHYRCGLHSGIPKCCTKFFVRVWRHLWTTPEGKWLMEEYLPIKERGWGYVPCPDCRAKGPPEELVRLVRCRCAFTNTMKCASPDLRSWFISLLGLTNEQLDSWAKRKNLPSEPIQDNVMNCLDDIRALYRKWKVKK